MLLGTSLKVFGNQEMQVNWVLRMYVLYICKLYMMEHSVITEENPSGGHGRERIRIQKHYNHKAKKNPTCRGG